MTSTSQNTSINILTRQQLELLNKRTLRYPLQIAEKDYFLALAVHAIYNSPLRKKLVFKGGTALHHCYLPQKRFSEDLDFTSLDSKISLNEVVAVLESSELFQAKKTYQSEFTIKIERLQFQGLLGQPGNIKVEIDRFQNVILPGILTGYKNIWKVNVSPLVMDKQEICAEKIRATAQRARYRDFYDLFFLINKLKVDYRKAIRLLSKKEIRTPIIAENIVNNWGIAKEQIERDLVNIYCSEKVGIKKIEDVIKKLKFDPIEN